MYKNKKINKIDHNSNIKTFILLYKQDEYYNKKYTNNPE